MRTKVPVKASQPTSGDMRREGGGQVGTTEAREVGRGL